MRRSDFYKSLSRIAGQFTWKVDEWGYLRAKDRYNHTHCPLEARAVIKYANTSWSNNGDIEEEDIEVIIQAADNPLKDIHDNDIARCRKALFRAVGLTKGL